jgi:hypothetical protein
LNRFFLEASVVPTFRLVGRGLASSSDSSSSDPESESESKEDPEGESDEEPESDELSEPDPDSLLSESDDELSEEESSDESATDEDPGVTLLNDPSSSPNGGSTEGAKGSSVWLSAASTNLSLSSSIQFFFVPLLENLISLLNVLIAWYARCVDLVKLLYIDQETERVHTALEKSRNSLEELISD